MSSQITRSRKIVALLSCAFVGISAFAADPFTDAMQEAYAPYRIALFQTNGQSQLESQLALRKAQQAWSGVTTRFSANPPAPYDRDTSFSRSLDSVAKVYAVAVEQVAANQLSAAHETLEAARDILADLRRRNQVVVFSDHMNAYHGEMERVLIDGPRLLLQPNGIHHLTEMVGILDYLAKRLTREASDALAKDAEFVGLVKAVEQSIADLRAALLTQDATRVTAAIGKIKQPYSRLFLKFG
jgi:replicative DNA helicase